MGSVTGNSNTIAGKFVKPVAELGTLEGLAAGGAKASAMAASPSEAFDGAKAYKDAKALNMMTVLEMHRRFHEETGVVFSSIYPGCIAETNLFREKRQWFRRARRSAPPLQHVSPPVGTNPPRRRPPSTLPSRTEQGYLPRLYEDDRRVRVRGGGGRAAGAGDP